MKHICLTCKQHWTCKCRITFTEGYTCGNLNLTLPRRVPLYKAARFMLCDLGHRHSLQQPTPWWVITTIPFASGKEYAINCETEIGPLQTQAFTHCSGSATTGQRSTRGKGQRPELTWGAQKPRNICISFPRTIIKFSAGQKRVVKEGKWMHKKRRDGNAIPRAKDSANNCTHTQWSVAIPLPASFPFPIPWASV